MKTMQIVVTMDVEFTASSRKVNMDSPEFKKTIVKNIRGAIDSIFKSECMIDESIVWPKVIGEVIKVDGFMEWWRE